MKDERRAGDNRPFKQNPQASLTWKPAHNEPFRWLPRHGEPLCIGEWFSQKIVKMIAWLPVYTAIVATLTFCLVVFGIPFVGGR